MSDDVMALSGLRRLVLHARDQLTATALRPPERVAAYERWEAPTIRAYAAQQVSIHVLTLVADCLPADGSLTADEAVQLRREHEESEKAWAARVTGIEAKVEGLVAERADLKEQVEAAVEAQLQAESLEVESTELLDQVRELARTDVPAAVRLLLDGDPKGGAR